MRKLFAVVLFAVGCSSAVIEGVDEQKQEALTSYAPVNGAVDSAWNGTKFCHPVYYAGSHAHAQARQMLWGIAATGGQIGQDRTNGWPMSDVYARIDTTGWNPPFPGATMAATYDCHNFADFHGTGGVQSNTYDFYLSWPDSGGTNPVTVSAPGTNAPVNASTGVHACWLDAVGHFSFGNKWAQLASVSDPNPSGWRWQLQAAGYAALYAEARCAYLGVNFAPTGWWVATPGHPAVANIRPSEGTCFVHRIAGQLDDGSVLWKKNFFWQLEVSGAVSEAHGYCVRY